MTRRQVPHVQDPDPDFRPVPGVPEPLGPGLRRLLAPNPSPMTFRGTNTYLVGTGEVAVIDPGPSDAAHLEAILSAVGTGRVTAIFVTHAHLDHSPLARPLADATGAPVLAFGGPDAGRSAAMQRLASSGVIGGGEGVDRAFRPDTPLGDGDTVAGDGWTLRALHTPGHFGNHLAFAWDDILFTGDLVMGWASSLVSPPDGDLTDFMASLERLGQSGWSEFHPGHGAPVATPAARISALLAHRRAREAAILAALADGPATPARLTGRIYTDTPGALMPAAERNVLAHLVDLSSRRLVTYQRGLSPDAEFILT